MIKKCSLWLMVLTVIGLALYQSLQFVSNKTPPAVLLKSPAVELANIPRIDIAPPKVAVYESAAKKKLGLPKKVQAAKNKHVLSAVKIQNDTHPRTITTVIDADTGDTETYARRDPLPWFKPVHTGEIRIDYGIKNGTTPTPRLTIRKELVQVKSFNASVQATLDGDGQTFVGGGIGFRW